MEGVVLLGEAEKAVVPDDIVVDDRADGGKERSRKGVQAKDAKRTKLKPVGELELETTEYSRMKRREATGNARKEQAACWQERPQ